MKKKTRYVDAYIDRAVKRLPTKYDNFKRRIIRIIHSSWAFPRNKAVGRRKSVGGSSWRLEPLLYFVLPKEK